MIDNFFFAKVNDDGTYGDPIPVSGVKEIKLDTTSDPFHEQMERCWDLMHTEESTFTWTMTWKEHRDFVWAVILNLKRSSRHLVSKNIWGR